MSTLPSRSPAPYPDREEILVLGQSGRTLALMRLAMLRGDLVRVVDPAPDPAVRRFVDQFALDFAIRAPDEADLVGAGAVLIALDDRDAENRLVRAARRRGIPVHVADRALVSDFTARAFLDQGPFTRLAA